jgi:ketosteroid isomerase-like protein
MKQRSVLGLLVGVVVASGALVAQQGSGIDPAVMSAAQTFHDAVRTCKVADVDQMVTDDMLWLHANGLVQDKKAFTAAVGACSFADIHLDVKTARMYGDAAILTGDLPFKLKKGGSQTLFVSQVYVKRNGKWLLASHQGTDTASYTAPKN